VRCPKDAELLVVRQENAVLLRQIGRVRYQLGDRLWLAALSRLIPRHRWGRGVRRDPGDAARLAPAAGRT
jgi:putative transposase